MKVNREQITRFLREHGGAVEFRVLMGAFGVSKGNRRQFGMLLDDLVDRGVLNRTSGRLFALAKPKDAPLSGDTVTGRLSTHRDGYGFVAPDDGGEDVFVPARYLRESMHGDLVELRLEANRRSGKREGRIVRTIEHGVTRVVGRYEALPRAGRIIPDDFRITQDIWVSPESSGGAVAGDAVVAEMVSYPSAVRGAFAQVVEVLGAGDDPEVEVQLIIRKYDLPAVFSPQALKEAAATSDQVADADLKGRTDLRGRVTVTIDGETARDFDDAVSASREQDGNIRLWVSIADVSHYVRPGSALDRDAYLRGTSVYFPDRCLPMLPEALSNGICSLNPEVDRLTLTAEMLFDPAGEMVQASFYPSVMRSAARLTYTIVAKMLLERDSAAIARHAELLPHLETMAELAGRLGARRKQRGSIDLDIPEPQVLLDENGHITAIVRSERNLAHRLIEEFMLAANEAVAAHLERLGTPSLYRVHEPPDMAKLFELREFVASFGYELDLSGDKGISSEFQRLLDRAAGTPEERLLNEVLLRNMKQARYHHENLGHFGLAAPAYTHFTSPIRRYPDLVIHRILKRVLSGGTKDDDRQFAGSLPEIALHTSKRERVAMEAERELVDLRKIQFMMDKVGEEFSGHITGVAWFGFFVELDDFFVEGLVPLTTLDDHYQFLEKQYALLGERSRRQFRIGDPVRIRVASVSRERRQIEFVPAELPLGSYQSSAPSSEEYRRVPVTGKRPSASRGAGKGSRGAGPVTAEKGRRSGKGRGRGSRGK